MYIITCGNENEIVMESGYVPNNPLFGLPPAQLDKDCISSCDGCSNCESAFPLATSEFDCGSCLDHSNLIGPTTQSSTGNSYWSEDMGSLPGLPPLDLVEPLPSLFPFTPCGVSYNRNERSHDMADVLLSLKHAVLKPSPEPSQPSHFNGNGAGSSQVVAGTFGNGAGPHQTSLSYTVHHPQMLVSPSPHPNHHHHHNHLPPPHHHHHHHHNLHQQPQHHHQQQQQQQQQQTNSSNYYDTSGGQYPAAPPPSLYPSMSVNVSMNMTMHHGYGADSGLQCAQGDNFLQWTPSHSNSSQMNHLYPPMVSPPQHYPNSATYSITADLRPPPSSSTHSLSPYPLPPLLPSSSAHSQNHLFDPFHSKSQSLSPDSILQRGGGGYYGTPPDHSSPSPQHLLSNSLHRTSPHYHQTGSPSDDCGLSAAAGAAEASAGNQTYDEHDVSMELLGESQETGGGGGGLKIRSSLKVLRFEDEDSRDSCSDSKPNLCRLCGKTYARPSTLKTHLRTHSGERPYRCPDCNKSFSQAANLTAHVRTHTGQKPFRCPICQRQFSQSSSVTTHMRTHSGERPYRCRACKKAFSDSSTLTKHLRIHSGEKPYQCKLCLLRFSQSGNLNRHMRVHGTNANGASPAVST